MPRAPSMRVAAAADLTPRVGLTRIRSTRALATINPRIEIKIGTVRRKLRSTKKRSQMASTSQRIPANPAAVTRAANPRATRANTPKASTKRYAFLLIKSGYCSYAFFFQDKTSHSELKEVKDKSSKHKSSSSKSSKRSHSPPRHEEESQKAKIPKVKSKSEEDSADGFDSSMGANFDDVLGLLNIPISSKKSSSNSKSKFVAKPTAAPSSSALSAPTTAGSSKEALSTSSRPTSKVISRNSFL